MNRRPPQRGALAPEHAPRSPVAPGATQPSALIDPQNPFFSAELSALAAEATKEAEITNTHRVAAERRAGTANEAAEVERKQKLDDVWKRYRAAKWPEVFGEKGSRDPKE